MEQINPDRARPVVLVVDDSDTVRKLVEMTLRRQGYDVAVATSGLTALAALAEHQPNLVLLDLMMLSLSGFEVCRAMRRHPNFSRTPIVVLSGRETAADRDAARAAGADAFLTKPFQPRQLSETVRQFTRRPQPQPEGTLAT